MRRRNLRVSGSVILAAAALMVPPHVSAQSEPFQSSVVVTDKNVGEPGIDIARDGTLYINAPSQLRLQGSASLLFRSDDCGRHWSSTSPGFLRGNLLGGADSDVAIDPSDGTIYYVDLYTLESTFSISRDKGFTWTSSLPVAGLPLQDRPWITSSGRGVVYDAYTQPLLGIAVTKWVLQGQVPLLTTLAADFLIARNNCLLCPPGNVVAAQRLDSDLLGLMDKVGVIYTIASGGVGFAQSTNGGLTWSQFTVSANAPGVDTTHSFPNVADDGSGTLHAVWLEVLPAGSSQCAAPDVGCSRVQYSRSGDFGQTWIPPLTLIAEGTSVFPWIDARDSKVSVALYHSDSVGTPDGVPGDTQWYTSYIESEDGGVDWLPPRVVDENPETTFVKTGPICTAGTNCVADRELLEFLQVVIDGRQRANVAWTRVRQPGLPTVPADTEIRYARQFGSFLCP
jgi:hypothetical protein